MYGFRGMGDTPTPDTFTAADLASLNPAVGPDASQVAPLQVGTLAQQISSGGQYSLNPSTGQLQQNVVAGISNSNLLLGVGGAIVGVMFLGAMFGGRRR